MGIVVNSKETNIISSNYSGQNKKNTGTQKYKVGDIIQGTVTNVTDQISIQFSEKKASVSKDILPGAKEGDTYNFRITDILSDGNMSLQYMPDGQNASSAKAAVFTTVVSDYQDKIMQNAKTSGIVSTEKEEETLDDLNDRMTQEDYQDLSKEGYSLERYELERFERALERIKTIRAQIEQSFETKIADVQEKEEDLKEIGLSQISNGAMRDMVASMLESMNLPASSQNISSVLNATKLASEVASLSDGAMSYLLKNEMQLTPVNLYMANYNGKSEEVKEGASHNQAWADLSQQVNQLLDKFQAEGIDATMADAKWLFDHEIPINEDSMLELKQIKSLQNDVSLAQISKTIVTAMAQGIAASDAPLFESVNFQVQSIVEQFNRVDDQALQTVIERGQTINLVNLNAAVRTQKQEQQQGNNQQSSKQQTAQDVQNLQKEIALITARRQLEEIRVKLTYEAGVKLSAKGIQIQTEGLDHLVTHLKGLEQEYYSKLLSEGGVEVNHENVTLLQDTFTSKSILIESPSFVLGVRFESRQQVTIQSLAEDGSKLTQQLKHANEAYEPLMTAPRADMGDSIKKAFRQMDSLLQEIGVEANEANKRAVRILSYNQMEINKTSIEQMKAYDHKVRELINDLTPAVTVQMIKDGVNPLETSIDELENYAKKILRENGASEEEKYSNYLAKIQRSNTLTEEQKESYIGIYRLLNNVEKTDGKAIGYLVKSEREINFNNLLSAVRSIKAEGMDTTIDDSFGTLSSLTFTGKSIDSQIRSAFTNHTELEMAKLEYNKQLSHQMYENANSDFFAYVEENDNLMEMSMEQLTEMYQEYAANNEETKTQEYNEMLNQIQQAMAMTDEMRFLKHHNTKVTLENVASAHQILSNPKKFRDQIQQLFEQTKIDSDFTSERFEDAKNYSDFQTKYKKVVNSTIEGLRECFEYPTLSVENMMAANQCLKGMSLLRDMSKEQFYQLPIEVNGKTMEVSLSLKSGGTETGKVSIQLHTETFGKISAELKASQNELKGLILCENKSMTTVLERTAEGIKSHLKGNQTKVQIYVGASESATIDYSILKPEKEEASQNTETLFEIAKAFITEVKSMDESNI